MLLQSREDSSGEFCADKIKSASAFFVLILIWTFTHSGWTAETPDLARSRAEIQRHVRYLASDELMGRGVDTPGIELARDYIAREFKRGGVGALRGAQTLDDDRAAAESAPARLGLDLSEERGRQTERDQLAAARLNGTTRAPPAATVATTVGRGAAAVAGFGSIAQPDDRLPQWTHRRKI